MKTEVYSWRLTSARKSALQNAARQQQKSVADLLNTITDDWLALQRRKAQEEDEANQRRLRAELMEIVGSIEGAYESSSEIRQGFADYLQDKHAATQRTG